MRQTGVDGLETGGLVPIAGKGKGRASERSDGLAVSSPPASDHAPIFAVYNVR